MFLFYRRHAIHKWAIQNIMDCIQKSRVFIIIIMLAHQSLVHTCQLLSLDLNVRLNRDCDLLTCTSRPCFVKHCFLAKIPFLVTIIVNMSSDSYIIKS